MFLIVINGVFVLKGWRSVAVVFVGVFLLAGCQQKESVDYYFAHPKRTEDVLKQCHATGDSSSERCVAVNQAAYKLQTLITSFRTNQGRFGQLLIQDQMTLADLRLKMAKLSKDSKAKATLKQQALDLEQKIKERLFIIGLFVHM
jgi:hypothetical protein